MWQTIETAPKDGSAILVYTADYTMVVAFWQEAQAFGWSDWCDYLDGMRITNRRQNYITHWMPLPEPPVHRSV